MFKEINNVPELYAKSFYERIYILFDMDCCLFDNEIIMHDIKFDFTHSELCFDVLYEIVETALIQLSDMKKTWERIDDENKEVMEFFIFIVYKHAHPAFMAMLTIEERPFTKSEYAVYAWSRLKAEDYKLKQDKINDIESNNL